jgi:hypothetical protein
MEGVRHEGLQSYPALFYNDMPIIVVGSVTLEGRRSLFSEGTEDQLSASAPGENVECAGALGGEVVRGVGTSVCRFL